MSSQNFQKPDFSRETRLGLVVYGGIALAIYMNGVCREFYNAVRGRGIYKLVKALTDADIVVDIVSGTSAGGINGVLLSYALTNSTESEVVDFEDFAQIWRDSGNIRNLMRQPNPKESSTESVLDGEVYYQQALAAAFSKAQSKKKKAPDGEWLSEFNELDLFVTGTDILGRVYKAFDDTGCAIEVKNHRAVFLLKHRQGRKQPFNPYDNPAIPDRTPEETYQALAKLCRITSCFPVAFPVVTIGLKDDNNKVDRQLIRWGILENRELPLQAPENGYQLHFVDGGVLDNRPFSYTIKQMYYRTASRPVDRKLFYIDPSPDRFSEGQRFKNMSRPNVLQVLEDSLIGMPTYESIANDLELIKEHNDKVRRYKSILANTEAPPNSDTATSEKIGIQDSIYLRSRLISLRDRVLPLVLGMEQGSDPDYSKQTTLDKVANLLVERIANRTEKAVEEKILQQFGEQIRNLDVEYALRKHFYIIQKLCRTVEKNYNFAERPKLQSLTAKLNRQIKLLEVIRTGVNLLLNYSEVSKSFHQLLEQEKSSDRARVKIYEYLLRLHRFLLDATSLETFSPTYQQTSCLEEVPSDFFQTLPSVAQKSNAGEWLSQKFISGVLEQFKQKIRQLSDPSHINENIWLNERFNYDGKENEGSPTILRQVEMASEALIAASQLSDSDEILLSFRRFRQLDQVIFPFEYLTDISEKEIITTIRISPDDAQLGMGEGKKVGDKLAGDTLYAFGGFFKKSWRSNDILWGRLDGLNRIVEALVTRQSVKNFPNFIERESQSKGCSKEEYLDFLLNESLPNAQPSDCAKIKTYLSQLADPNLRITESQLKSILYDLVLEGHRQIVNTDLQNVIEDAVYEQLDWNVQQVKSDNATPKYDPVRGYFDQTVSTVAAAKIAKDAIASLSQSQEAFFRQQYQIGQEKLLENIPEIVLVNLATRFGLVFRDMIGTALGTDRAAKLRKHPTYQFLDKSLQFFYWWLQLNGPLGLRSPGFIEKRPIALFLQILLLLIAIVGVAVAVAQSWVWMAIAVGATILCWFLGSPWKNRKKK